MSEITDRITDKIDNIYYVYILSDKDIGKTSSLTNTTRPTIIKYITIKERLDFTLFGELDKKGKEKLPIGFATDLCNYVLNPDIFYWIFHSFLCKSLTLCFLFFDQTSLRVYALLIKVSFLFH